MILLLGATGYIGQAFARELRRRGDCFIPLSRHAFDYTRFELLFDYTRKIRPQFIINAAGYGGRPNVDMCELARLETFQANTLLPQTIARVCLMTNTPWGHVSSGCIYAGGKIFENSQMRIERDLNRPEVRQLFERQPEKFFGFTELDEPNFSFRCPPCSFWSGTKALAEEALRGSPQVYVWRPGPVFDERDMRCNWLARLLHYPRIYNHVTCASHLGDFVRGCLELMDRGASFGIYNLVNPGATTTRKIAERIQTVLKPRRSWEYWVDDREFYSEGAKALRSSCVLDGTKLLRAGVKLRPVDEAIEAALERWERSAEPRPAIGAAFESMPA